MHILSKDERESAQTTTRPVGALADVLRPIVDAICLCAGVAQAALWWRMDGEEGIVMSVARAGAMGADAESRLARIARGLELLERPLDRDSAFALHPAEIEALSGGRPGAGVSATAVVARAGSVGTAQLRAIVLVMKPHDEAALPAAELGWRGAACAISAAEKERSREFWRGRAMNAASESARSRAQSAAARDRAEIAALRRELGEQRARAAKLALRMFTAVDEERARIARDLHDDHAQVLAAAQVALEKGGPEAVQIFRRASEQLRRAIRALNGAALGDLGLEQALRTQFRLLSDAGIEPKLTLGPGAKRLSRSAQQLCWHVAREALANVIRHSEASRVEVVILRQAEGATISITDNGRGIAAKNGRERGGLDGLAGRLSLMGGKLAVESGGGTTRVIAEIPQIA